MDASFPDGVGASALPSRRRNAVKKLRTVEDIILRLGGPAAIARQLPDVSRNAAQLWLKPDRHGIPARYWLSLVRLPVAQSAGLTLEHIEAAVARQVAEAKRHRQRNT